MAESFFNFKVENPKLPRKIVKPFRFRDSADYTTKNTPTTVKGYSRTSKYAAPITAVFADTRFLIGSRKTRKTLKIE